MREIIYFKASYVVDLTQNHHFLFYFFSLYDLIAGINPR